MPDTNKKPIVYFMYDNHTFSVLSNNFSEAVDQVNKILEKGNKDGSICSHEYKEMIHLQEDNELMDKKYISLLNMYKYLKLSI